MHTHAPLPFSRRSFLQNSALSFSWLAFSGLAARGNTTIRETHFPGKAKRVIFLCMRGAPSHMDTFDYKPKLNADHGKPGLKENTQLYGTQWKFSRHGQSGMWASELFPNLVTHADDLCMINSMQTDPPAHSQAYVKMHTGTSQFVRPSMGAWVSYGLGFANENLPGFITITPPSGFGGAQNYGSAFLPAIYQATPFGVDKRPIVNAEVLDLKPRQPLGVQRTELDLVQSFNRSKLTREPHNPQVEGVIESFELAFKMQKEMPAVMDLSKESEATKKLYGIDNPLTDDCGRKCLLARRLVEAGVRFVEVTHGDWDHHSKLNTALPETCASVDVPITGLLTDLKARGLLKDTLVIWSGEFGRTPHSEGVDGRDHNVGAFTMWMAGGGVRAGYTHGNSGDYGYEAVDGIVNIHDWHATVLHLLGFNHEKLTYQYAGRNFRLTDTTGTVVKELIG
jgi:hypothetical protein